MTLIAHVCYAIDRIAFYVTKCLQVIDHFIARRFQRHIADPLQFADISLACQFYYATIALLMGWIAASADAAAKRNWVQLGLISFITLIVLFEVVYGLTEQSRSRFSVNNASMLYTRIWWIFLLMLDLTMMTTLPPRSFLSNTFCVVECANLARYYIAISTPKPPAPQRQLQTVNQSI